MNKGKILQGAAGLLLAILLIFLMAFLFTGLSTGWFTDNKDAKAKGIEAQLEGTHLTAVQIQSAVITRQTKVTGKNPKTIDVNVNTWADGNTLLPGDVITVTAQFGTTHYNDQSTDKIPTEFLIRAPGDGSADQPVTIGNKSYFLSTQIWVKTASLQKIQNGSPVPGSNIQLKDDSGIQDPASRKWLGEHELVWNTDKLPTPPEIPLGTKDKAESVTNQKYLLDPDSTYQLTVTLEFFNDDGTDTSNGSEHNQSPLRGDYTQNDPAEVIPSSFSRLIVARETERQKVS